MAPPEATPSFLPAPTTIIDRLPAPVVARLGASSTLVTQKTPKWGLVLSELDKHSGFSGMDSWEVNNLIYCMAVDQRAALSERLLRMMGAAGVLPDTLTFDLLMLAQAEVKNPEEVKRLFGDMRERERPAPSPRVSFQTTVLLTKYVLFSWPTADCIFLRPPPQSTLSTL